MAEFGPAYTLVVELEGGFAEPPQVEQPTNHGITQSDYDALRSAAGLTLQSVEFISDEETSGFYQRWWNGESYFSGLPQTLANYLFQLSVLDGTATAIKVLQRALGVQDDGVWGPKTAAAVGLNLHNLPVAAFREAALHFADIVVRNPSKLPYLKGWLTRAFRT